MGAEDQYQLYHDYLRKLDDIKIENQRLIARNTLIISGGAFTFSVTLLKEIYTKPWPCTKAWLVASWILFGLCAFLQFYSDHLSSRAVEVQRENYKSCYPDKMDRFGEMPNSYSCWVRAINWITPWLICVGFIAMIVFSIANFVSPKEI